MGTDDELATAPEQSQTQDKAERETCEDKESLEL
jgi:hypothetical protein